MERDEKVEPSPPESFAEGERVGEGGGSGGGLALRLTLGGGGGGPGSGRGMAGPATLVEVDSGPLEGWGWQVDGWTYRLLQYTVIYSTLKIGKRYSNVP